MRTVEPALPSVQQSEIPSSRLVGPADLSPEVAAEWSEWFPAEALWTPIAVSSRRCTWLPGAARLPGRSISAMDSLICWGNGWIAGAMPGWPASSRRAGPFR